MKGEFLTVSNLLSISRVVLVIPFACLMLLPQTPQRVTGSIFLFVAILTDKFDGVLARKLGQETEWGRVLDPLCDKIGIGIVAIVMLRLGDIPLWFFIALAVRDLLIFGGGMYIKSARNVVLPSNQAGKWTVGLIAITLMCALLGFLTELQPFLYGVCTAGLLVSFIMYVSRFVATMREPAR
jgi:CDP-diacylglycerol--glycerol-3-phosphate 3-phosphatidyltransferase